MDKISRNDPCPCGSGKKYKKCCLNNVISITTKDSVSKDPQYVKIRNMDEKLGLEIFKFTMEYFGYNSDHALSLAWAEFKMYDDSIIDFNSIEFPMSFLPWFVYNWECDEPDDPRVFSIPEKIPAKFFLTKKSHLLSQAEKDIILANLNSNFSFYLVKEIIGPHIKLKDLLCNIEITILDYSASTSLKPGLIILGRTLTINGQNIMVGSMMHPLLPQDQLDIIDFKNELSTHLGINVFTNELLYEYAFEIRELYYSLLEKYVNMPKLCNTDGEQFLFCKVRFKLNCTPIEIVEKLYPLTLEKNSQFILESEEAIFNTKGELTRITFPWLKKKNKIHKSWDNTILGHIFVTEKQLAIEVNSEERATKIIKEIDKLLGNKVKYLATDLQTPENMLKTYKSKKHTETKQLPSPEEQKAMQEFVVKHWQEWLNTKIPLLDNKTPRQAAKTKEGREKLEILLQDFAYRNENFKGNEFGPDIDKLRQELHLDEYVT